MAKEIVIEVDERTGDTTVEANGFAVVGGVCQGQEATKFIEDALGGVGERQMKPDFQGGRVQRQNRSEQVSQR